MTTYFADHLLPGVHASRPAATAVPEGTLYSCSDHNLIYQSDGSTWSTWATMAPPTGGGNPVVYDIERRTAGDLTISSTTAGAAAGTIGDLVVAAAAGDLLMVGISARNTDAQTSSLRLDVATIVSAAVVNYLSSLTNTPASTGISAWFILGNGDAGTEVPYVVQAGDVSGGNVTLSLRAWSSGTAKLLSAQAAAPLAFWVRNLGQ